MIPKKSNERKKLWTTPNFHKFLYEKKADAPTKTLLEIQDDIANFLRKEEYKPKNEKKKKKYESPFFPKL